MIVDIKWLLRNNCLQFPIHALYFRKMFFFSILFAVLFFCCIQLLYFCNAFNCLNSTQRPNVLSIRFFHIEGNSFNQTLLEGKCNFITHWGHTSAGLGNQMFFYASLYGIAKSANKQPVIYKPLYVIKGIFQTTIPGVDFKPNDPLSVGDDNKCCTFVDKASSMLCNRNVSLWGYRQSWKYFRNVQDEIRQEFKFTDQVSSECNATFGKLTDGYKSCAIIAVHMRRGDFAWPEKMKIGYIPADGAYLQRTIRYFEYVHYSKQCVLFLVFGDDSQWVSLNLPTQKNIIIVKDNKPELDLCLMTKCNATVISTGTFGWWAAFLTGGPVVYMKDQCTPNSSLCQEFKYEDYFIPELNWIPM